MSAATAPGRVRGRAAAATPIMASRPSLRESMPGREPVTMTVHYRHDDRFDAALTCVISLAQGRQRPVRRKDLIMAAVASPSTAPAKAEAKLLRFALKQDAIGSGANGLVYLAAAAIFGSMFGLPAAMLVPVGAFLVAFAGFLLYLASRPAVNRAAVITVMAVNVAWVIASAEVLIAGWFPLTGLGIALVIAQAVVVAGFAGLQFAGLRKS
ncbi:hypothetical protein [Nonomuraea sp. NPDC048916]|uniref:hypothetical protein n=1 Tax=Nonomuraea sp. NPDC048916 TaxID=3154232 RepID=UPI0033CDE527